MRKKLIPVLVLVFAEICAFQHVGSGRTRVRHAAQTNTSVSRQYCDTRQLEYKLSKLESQTVEKSDLLNSELRETNHRLQNLEWQTSDVNTALEQFRNELQRFTQTHQTGMPVSTSLDLRIQNLNQGMQVVVAAVRSLKAEIGSLKRNLSSIADSTRSLMMGHGDLVTKPFLTDSLVDVKHHHVVQQSRSGFTTPKDLPANCKEVQERGKNVSGIYRIQPELAPRGFMVVCDMETRGGGWTYIHNRHEGSQDFYLNWHSYKLGFGNLGGEFWLGLEYLHQLTGDEVNELLVELVDLEERRVFAHYEAFSVGDEAEGFALKVLGGYSGNAGDSLIYHAGAKFSTKDMDHDEWAEGSCAQAHTGAWWYRNCDKSNLNGRYLKGETPENYLYQGMYWGDFRGAQYSLLRARMMVRPRESDGPVSVTSQEDVPSY